MVIAKRIYCKLLVILVEAKKIIISVEKTQNFRIPDFALASTTESENNPKPPFQSLSDVEKDVAGVKNRIYRNAAYKIHRPGAAVVYVSAECATPLHTLRRVLDRTALYDELANVDRHELRNDFCEMLKSIISRSPEARGKCELVFFDDEDPTQNLADVLLDKIRELEPDFENIISKK